MYGFHELTAFLLDPFMKQVRQVRLNFVNLEPGCPVMKRVLWIIAFLLISGTAVCQKTLVVERIGTGRKYGFNTGDFLKLRTKSKHDLLRSFIWDLTDSTITIGQSHTVRLDDVAVVYKEFGFPKRLGRNLLFAGGLFFAATTINNLIAKNQVFTESNLIITGSILAAGAISIILSEKAIRIGLHWKLKVLDIPRL
jgi:hypothetical protein